MKLKDYKNQKDTICECGSDEFITTDDHIFNCVKCGKLYAYIAEGNLGKMLNETPRSI